MIKELNKKLLQTGIFFWLICAVTPVFATQQEQEKPVVKKSGFHFFLNGYEQFEKKNYLKASGYFYSYISTHGPEDSEYNWAEFFLGISLRKSGFSHASIDVLSHLISRKPNPKIATYVLELFEEVTRTLPYDTELVIEDSIAGHEYAFIEGDIANFVHYYQGVFDWERGFMDWGNKHFDHIKPQSYYYYKYLFKKALLNIYEDNIDEAIVLLKEILKEFHTSDDFLDDVRQTLARLLYEKKEYKKSLMIYKEIKRPMIKQAKNFMERAWTQLRIGKSEKAMGLLYAYSAPSFKQFFTPEYYILKSFLYKNRCHYNKALKVVSEFKKHYFKSLKHIYKRGKAADDPSLLLVLMTKKQIRQSWDFLTLLENERKEIDFANRKFNAYLKKIYDLQIEQTSALLKKQVTEEFEDIADNLLRYEEEAHLMEYEIGLDMYQRIYQFHYKEEEEKEESEKRIVVYPFQGEYWNDELADYRVTLPDKCESMEEWDIFFK